MKLSPGKRKGLEAVSDSHGIIGALAIDQRDALRRLFSAELNIEKSSVPREQLEEFNETVKGKFRKRGILDEGRSRRAASGK